MKTLGIDIGGTAVKAAVVQDGKTIATGTSVSYTQPSVLTLRSAIAEAVNQVGGEQPDCQAIGLCIPGIVDQSSGRIVKAINLTCVVGSEPTSIIAGVIEVGDAPILRFTDSYAAAHDVWSSGNGRIAAISIGTGVGLCVLDDGVPLDMGNGTPGHLGQVDVSLGEEDPPIGPDGGRGGLEAYVGWRALQSRYGEDAERLEDSFLIDDAPLKALSRAIRIVHAIYRPQRVVLLGGVGTAMGPCVERLRLLVSDHLTSLARKDWILETGDSLHHAAAGAAKLAARSLTISR